MKVAHVTPSYHPANFYGGPPESAHQLSRHLARAGCHVRVLTTNANGPAALAVDTSRELELETGLQVRYCARQYAEVAPELFALLPRFVKWCDVVHLNAVFNATTIPTLLLARAANKPVVWSARGALQSWETIRRARLKSAWKSVCRLSAPTRTVIHVTSQAEQNETEKSMPGFETAAIPNGVEVPSAVVREPRHHTLRLLYLGRIHPIKGLENLLDACELLVYRHQMPLTLVVAGDGEPAYVAAIRERITRLKLNEQVKLLGHVSSAERAGLFAAADLLAAPSFTENFGLTIAEALAHGVPVVASTGTPWQGLVEQDAGLWVSNAPDSLAAAIRTLSDRPLTELGLRGRIWMERDYSWPRVADEMRSLYERLLHSGAQGGGI